MNSLDAAEPGFFAPRSPSVLHLKSVSLSSQAIRMAECLSLLELRPGLVSGVCRDSREGELHWLLVEVTALGATPLYASPGVGNSYYMEQTVFASNADGPYVILAEAGAEFSYGIGVYLLEAQNSVTYAGELAVGVNGSEAWEGPLSAVPFVLMDWSESGLCLRFTRDLVHGEADGTYRNIPSDSVAFLYASGKLSEVDSCSSRRRAAPQTLVLEPTP